MSGPGGTVSAGGGASGFGVVALGRAGSTPLRFRGRRLAKRSAAVAGLAMSIALWSRAAGGLAVGVEIRTGAARRGYAASSADLDGIAAFLETLEPDLIASAAPRSRRRRLGALAAAAELGSRSRRLAARQLYRDLVGHCIAEWTATRSGRATRFSGP